MSYGLEMMVVIGGAYLLGSIPSAVLITRWLRNTDVRDVGSGHAGATNTIRAAGWLGGAIVVALDISKGFLAVELALRLGTLAGALAAFAVVVGHCWPLFAGFRGGMGVATTGGALLAAEPLGFAIGLGVVVLLTLLLRHTARANVITGIALAPLFWLSGLSLALTLVGGAAGAVVAIRSTSDWYRVYEELWLDRSPQSQ